MSRDIVMAQSIVLTLSEAHAPGGQRPRAPRHRAPFWLAPSERQSIVSIGMLEREDRQEPPESTVAFDAYVITERADRADPCKDLTQRLR